MFDLGPCETPYDRAVEAFAQRKYGPDALAHYSFDVLMEEFEDWIQSTTYEDQAVVDAFIKACSKKPR